jgi:hypothetical protein
MGAQDSTAGLSVMAMQVNQADLQIQMQQNEYNHGLAQLDLEARGIMTNFTNSVLELGMQTKASEAEAQNNLSTKLQEIEKETLLNDKEKNKVQMQAFSDFNTKLQTLKKEQREEEWKLMEFSYKQVQDKIERAHQLTGDTGTIWSVDEDGKMFDSGVETLDSRQWQESQLLERVKFEHNIQQDAYTKAFDMIDRGMSTDSVEQVVGLPVGSLSGLRSTEEIKMVLAQKQEMAEMEYLLDSSGYGEVAVNGALAGGDGSGAIISNAFADGSKQGQCGYFARTKFTTLGPIGDLLTDKLKRADNVLQGFKLDKLAPELMKMVGNLPGVGGIINAVTAPIREKLPKTGDMLIHDVGTQYGHVSMVNSVNPPDKEFPLGSITLTESNWHGDEKVSNNRRISIIDKSIVGINRGNLKEEYKASMLQQQYAIQPIEKAKTNFDLELDYIAKTGDVTEKQKAQLIKFGQLTGQSELVYSALEQGINKKTGATDTSKLNATLTMQNRYNSNQIVKDFNLAQSKYRDMEAIINTSVKGPADLALVYEFMKALDPTSVVREAEFASAANSGNIFSGQYAKYNGYLTSGGGFLPDEVRESFLDIAEQKFLNRQQEYNNFRGQIKTTATNFGLNPDDIIIDYDLSDNEDYLENLPSGKSYDADFDLYNSFS